jgi:hypothetical protein
MAWVWALAQTTTNRNNSQEELNLRVREEHSSFSDSFVSSHFSKHARFYLCSATIFTAIDQTQPAKRKVLIISNATFKQKQSLVCLRILRRRRKVKLHTVENSRI